MTSRSWHLDSAHGFTGPRWTDKGSQRFMKLATCRRSVAFSVHKQLGFESCPVESQMLSPESCCMACPFVATSTSNVACHEYL